MQARTLDSHPVTWQVETILGKGLGALEGKAGLGEGFPGGEWESEVNLYYLNIP